MLLAGCGKKEEAAAPAPQSGPAKVSIESTTDAPPPPPPAPAADGTIPAPAANAPAPEEKRDPDAPPKSVYDNISPEEKVKANRFNRNRDWMMIFKNGSDSQKQQAKKAIDALPPAERAEFENMTKMYGIKYP